MPPQSKLRAWRDRIFTISSDGRSTFVFDIQIQYLNFKYFICWNLWKEERVGEEHLFSSASEFDD